MHAGAGVHPCVRFAGFWLPRGVLTPPGAADDSMDYVIEARNRVHLDEWLNDYDVEKSCYNSLALEAEVKLRRAQVFTSKMAYPNGLQTAVAFEIFDSVARVCGRYKVCVLCPSQLLHPGSLHRSGGMPLRVIHGVFPSFPTFRVSSGASACDRASLSRRMSCLASSPSCWTPCTPTPTKWMRWRRV